MNFTDFIIDYFGHILIGVVLAIFAGGVVTPLFLNGIGASEGSHTGYVTAIEHNDNILWDANIVYFKTDAESTQEDKYCVDDLILMHNLKQYSKLKTQITIQYKNPFLFWKWICNGGDSIIVGVV